MSPTFSPSLNLFSAELSNLPRNLFISLVVMRFFNDIQKDILERRLAYLITCDSEFSFVGIQTFQKVMKLVFVFWTHLDTDFKRDVRLGCELRHKLPYI